LPASVKEAELLWHSVGLDVELLLQSNTRGASRFDPDAYEDSSFTNAHKKFPYLRNKALFQTAYMYMFSDPAPS